AHTPIQRCQLHKARNVIERLPKPLRASVRRVLRQAWELDDADKAERLLRNLARRLDQEAPGVAASILKGLDEMLTVNRLGLPVTLRRSLACTNSIENMMGTVRRVCRNVKRWRNAAMALRWTAAGMKEAAKGFRRLKAYKIKRKTRRDRMRAKLKEIKEEMRQRRHHSIPEQYTPCCCRMRGRKGTGKKRRARQMWHLLHSGMRAAAGSFLCLGLARNPQTGALVEVRQKRFPFFRTGKEMR